MSQPHIAGGADNSLAVGIDNSLAVGIDLGGTNLRAALVDVGDGKLLHQAKRKLEDRAPESVARSIAELTAEVDPDRRRTGVGIGIAAMLKSFTGVVVNAPNLGWRDVDFRSRVNQALATGEPVDLYNDLNAITLGEQRFGSARGKNDVLCVYVGTGVGAGMVLAGRLYSGASHLAGEMGHVKVVLENGRLCGCGARGCLEAYTSGTHIAQRAREELRTRESLAVQIAGSREAVHAGHLDEAARQGDAYALGLWDEISRVLGLALGAAITTLNPSRLVMGGGVLSGAPLLGEKVRERLRIAANAPSLVGFDVVETTLGDNAGVLGAAAAIVDQRKAP